MGTYLNYQLQDLSKIDEINSIFKEYKDENNYQYFYLWSKEDQEIEKAKGQRGCPNFYPLGYGQIKLNAFYSDEKNEALEAFIKVTKKYPFELDIPSNLDDYIHPDYVEKLIGIDNLKQQQEKDEKIYQESLKSKQINLEKKQKELNGGIFLADSWGSQPFWLIFGNVEECKFVTYNYFYDKTETKEIYKDKDNRTYLMIPLMKLQPNGVTEIYNALVDAWNNEGLRTKIEIILAACYKILPKYVMIENKKYFIKKNKDVNTNLEYQYILQSRGRKSNQIYVQNTNEIAEYMKQNSDIYNIQDSNIY